MSISYPTTRWTPANLDPRQARFFESTAMLNVVHSGRRSWKTEGAKRRLVKSALQCPYADGRFFACAPTQQQSRDIYWDDLRAMVPDFALATGNPEKDIRESDMTISLRGGVKIRVAGLDRPARIEGGFWDGGVIDEFADCRPDAFEQHVLPMLVRPRSYADIVGVPGGRSHYLVLVKRIKSGELANGQVFHWDAAEVLHLYLGKERAEQVLSDAKTLMDEDTFNQEWAGVFVSQRSQVFHCFESDASVRPHEYDPDRPLVIALDFNTSPGVAAFIQTDDVQLGLATLAGDTFVFDEIHIAKGSNTARVCTEILRRYGGHRGEVHLHGDASGGAKTTSQTLGDDWTIVDEYLRPAFGSRLKSYVPKRNPAVRIRVNATNARFKNAAGERHLFIDARCTHTIADFEAVSFNDHGDIDKTDPTVSHHADAVSYAIAAIHPLVQHQSQWTQF